MAKIILEKGESFEHSHAEESRSSLGYGDVKFTVSGEEVELKAGETVTVPKDASHVITNTGSSDACVNCYH